MTIPKKGSRPISIDGIGYRWYIRSKPTNNQIDYGNGYLTVAIDIEDTPGTTLVILTNFKHPNDWSTSKIIPVTPLVISTWISKAITLGWNASEKGHSFHVRVDVDGKMINV